VKIVSSNEMRRIDRLTIDDYGVPSLVLMERAGFAVASKVRELFPPQKVIVLAGKGNNGGDGLVIARILHNWGYRVKVLILANIDELSNDCAIQYEITKKFNINIIFTLTISGSEFHGAIIIDAIFGTGINKAVNDEFINIFTQVNNSQAPVVSVDIPSGISSDTGQIMGSAIRANYTITFGLPKIGHFLHPGAFFAGKLFVDDIGFDSKLLRGEELKNYLIEKAMFSGFLSTRQSYSHKGDYGHVLIVAGSKGKTGAALLSARACLRSGSGLVTLAVPESLIDIIQSRVTEEMTFPLADNGDGVLSSKAIDEILTFASDKIDAIAIGPGIGITYDTQIMLSLLVANSNVPLIIDADGVNSLCANPKSLNDAKSPIIITPHPGEMARLYNAAFKQEFKIADIERNRLDIAKNFAGEFNIYVVLKGVPTIIAAPSEEAFINPTGNPGMATAGSGDVLTGIIVSFVGQKMSPLNSAIAGVYLHGVAGDIASAKRTQQSMIASDIIEYLNDAFKRISS